MPLRHQLKRLITTVANGLRAILGVEKSEAPSVTSLSTARKLTPIDDVVARVGREPFAPD